MKNRSIFYITFKRDGEYDFLEVRKSWNGVMKLLNDMRTKDPDFFKNVYSIEILDMTDEEGNRYD